MQIIFLCPLSENIMKRAQHLALTLATAQCLISVAFDRLGGMTFDPRPPPPFPFPHPGRVEDSTRTRAGTRTRTGRNSQTK